MPFQTPLDVRADDAAERWTLLSPLVYKFPRLDLEITVPAGFDTDLASIPQLLQNIFPVNDKHRKAAVLHDYLYKTHIVERAMADLILREACKECGVAGWKRWCMWAGVRLGGWKAWKDDVRNK